MEFLSEVNHEPSKFRLAAMVGREHRSRDLEAGPRIGSVRSFDVWFPESVSLEALEDPFSKTSKFAAEMHLATALSLP